MREITVREVDIGCLACEGQKCTGNPATAFICGVLAGLTKDEVTFCSPHYHGFQNAMNGIAGKAEAR